jgi:ankyrin repeat domain-containing protein 50
VFCQVEQLKKSKSTKPSSLKAALSALPKTLDKTYQRMLNNIDENDRPNAFTLIRWLAYAQSPPSLGELAEASM